MRLPLALTALVVASSSPSPKLAVDLYAQLKAAPGNLALSPASVRTALAVTQLGAKGTTAKEIEKLVGANVVPAGHVAIVFYPDIQPAKEFVDAASSKLGAQVVAVGPNDGTKPDQGVVIVDDITFHGAWKTKFEQQLTRDEPFDVDAKHSVRALMMHLDETTLAAAHTKDADVVALPYEDGSRFVLVVPTKRTGLAQVESKLQAVLATRLREQPVRVSMPRFHVATNRDMGDALRALGMKNAWCTSDAKPDFSGVGKVLSDEPICIESVMHEATVDVDEKGTTASASTTVHLVAKEGEREGVLDIDADHPFAFAIEDANGDITFLRRVVDPSGDTAPTPSSTTPTKD